MPAEQTEDPKTLISPAALVEEASGWYAAAKQEDDSVEALVRVSYGIACLRAIQGKMRLEEVKEATLPTSISSPDELMKRMAALQNALGTKIKQGSPPVRANEQQLRSLVENVRRQTQMQMKEEPASAGPQFVPRSSKPM